MRPTQRRGWLIAPSAALALLGGCEGAPSDAPSPTESASSTAAPATPTATGGSEATPTPAAGTSPVQTEPTAATPAPATPTPATPAPATPTPATPIPTPEPCAPFDAASATVDGLSARFSAELYPLMARTTGGCTACHFPGSGQGLEMGASGPTTFESLWLAGYLGDGVDTLLDRVTRAGAGSMPLGGPAWSAAEQAAAGCFVRDMVSANLTAPDPNQGCEDPGRVVLHRLNRVEYDNTVRDLLWDESHPAAAFPVDDRGYGFDNIAEVLSVSPLLVDGYWNAAEGLVDSSLGVSAAPVRTRTEAETLDGTGGGANSVGYSFGSEGFISVPMALSHDATYAIDVRAYGQQAGDEWAKMQLSLDGLELQVFDVAAVEVSPEIYSLQIQATAGAHTLDVAFINDFFKPRNPEGDRDRNLIVDWVEVTGPLDAVPEDSERRDNVLICEPQAGEELSCARTILASFGLRAWRRPLTSDELDRLQALVQLAFDQGDSWDAAIRLPLRAMLLSPHFLFRVEDDSAAGGATRSLNGYELASRLSYFIWSSTPDDALFALAADGSLADPQVMASTVERMLADEKAAALTDNFAGQWLETRAIREAQPDPERFPEFDEALRAAMEAQTLLRFQDLLDQDLRHEVLLTPGETWLNDRLAAHYGLAAVGGDDMRRVTLDDPTRGSLLGHGAFLTVSSHANETSAVLRGSWVLSQLLCQAPPPPPPGVMPSEEAPPEGTSQREELEQHRADPYCASCHQTMDPIGFGLDNFDAIGRWRTLDDYGQPIDATGVLPPDVAFDGPVELTALLREDPAFDVCVARQLLTYAVGRAPTDEDDCYARQLNGELDEAGGGMRQLVHLITQSEPFRARQPEAEDRP